MLQSRVYAASCARFSLVLHQSVLRSEVKHTASHMSLRRPAMHALAGGDALVYGEALSAPGSITRIREHMGVCPQTDILWAELTGTEHLQLYGAMKARWACWPVPSADTQDAPHCGSTGCTWSASCITFWHVEPLVSMRRRYLLTAGHRQLLFL